MYVFSGKGSKSNHKQMTLLKLKSFCTVKETIKETKRPPIEWKMFSKGISDKHIIIYKIYEELTQLKQLK